MGTASEKVREAQTIEVGGQEKQVNDFRAKWLADAESSNQFLG
jgi:hypothetical protein